MLKWRSFTNSRIISSFYYILFPTWTKRLSQEFANCDTVLDLGCGYNSPIQHCHIPFSVGVEVFEPYLIEARKKGIHDEYIRANVTELEIAQKSFDAVMAIEIIEHLTKEEAYRLIEKMEIWARNKVIISTPNGYIQQDGYDNNPSQVHKSGWTTNEFKNLGYRVHGKNGWKILRGDRGLLKFKPTFLWQVISDITQRITYYYPELATQLFATKRIESRKINELCAGKRND
ncbi:class I SAM-dependent methyltransferase [Chloroflexota bacterium]